MKGLLIKDFMLLRSYGKSLLLLFALFFIIGLTSGIAFIVGIVMIESVMLAITTFSYDDAAKWNTYMLSMPVSRKTAVQEKYLFAMLRSLIGILLAIVAGFAAGMIRGAVDWLEIFASVGGCLFMSCIYVSLMIPITYRYGTEKMRFLLLGVFFFLFFILFGGYVLLKKTAPGALETLARMWTLLPILTVAALAVSYTMSVHIFEKKEI